jgi:hypothetical protein
MTRIELQIEPESSKGLTGLLQLVRAGRVDRGKFLATTDAKADSARHMG